MENQILKTEKMIFGGNCIAKIEKGENDEQYFQRQSKKIPSCKRLDPRAGCGKTER